jgi:hypothetical protein
LIDRKEQNGKSKRRKTERNGNINSEYKKSLSLIRVQTKNGETAKTQIKKNQSKKYRNNIKKQKEKR